MLRTTGKITEEVVEKLKEKHSDLWKLAQKLKSGPPHPDFRERDEKLRESGQFDDAAILNILGGHYLMDKEKNLRGEGKDRLEAAAHIYRDLGDYVKESATYQYAADCLLSIHRDEGWAGDLLDMIRVTCVAHRDPSEGARKIYEVVEPYLDLNPYWVGHWLEKVEQLYREAAEYFPDHPDRQEWLERARVIGTEIPPDPSAGFVRRLASVVAAVCHWRRDSYISRKSGAIVKER